MGIYAKDGEPATDLAIAVCKEHQIDLTGHRSRSLIPDELKTSRLILTMEPQQVDYIDVFFPQVSDRTYMLASWPDRKRKKTGIPDPVGGSINLHRKTFRVLEECIGFLTSVLSEEYLNFPSGGKP